jgi:restriction endonuclease S subunit
MKPPHAMATWSRGRREGEISRMSKSTKSRTLPLEGISMWQSRRGERNKIINVPLFTYQLNSPRPRKWIVNHSVRSTMSRLNTSILSHLPIISPPLTEQQKIATVLASHDNNIGNEERCLNKMKLQKKGLIHDLLTGKVRVRVPMEESRC